MHNRRVDSEERLVKKDEVGCPNHRNCSSPGAQQRDLGNADGFLQARVLVAQQARPPPDIVKGTTMKMVSNKLTLLLVSIGIALSATLFVLVGSGAGVGGRFHDFNQRFQTLKRFNAERLREETPSSEAASQTQNERR